ncbi:MAG: sulfatase [Phycisphaerales bacterium]|nr:MAG: sulfatase [Phycisphaerales bacterium]
MNSGNCSRRKFVSAVGLGAVGWAVSRSVATSGAAGTRKPNIVFILADDLGWAELGCCGNTFNETPHLDRLAKQGMRFTDAYAAAPVCSPYRAALMTGLYPARVGITDYLRPGDTNHLARRYVTIAETLRRAGYVTGIVGKWHLSGYANHGAEEFPPAVHGFEETIVSENRGIGGGSYFHPYHFNREIDKRLPGKEHLIDRCNLEAVEFIERHKNRPFFLYLSHYAVHTRLEGKPEFVSEFENKSGAGKGQNARRNNPHLAAQLKSIDQGVGMVIRKLDELGLADDTVVVFTGDNGGESRVTSNGPLRAGKSTLYEGGIRVPLVIRYPKVVPAGTTCKTTTSNIDFYPTFRELAGIKPDSRATDGVSITTLLRNAEAKLKRDTLYWHYPLDKPHFLGGRSAGAIRKGHWKLIQFFDTGEKELYSLEDDVGEQNNLASKNPDKVAELLGLLAAWRKQVDAKIPSGQQGGEDLGSKANL